METVSPRAAAEEKITRFDIHQIIQHASLMISFILLVITGIPLKFYSSPVSQWWIALWGGVEFTRSVHHFAAWVMVFICIYHIGYLWYTIAVLKRPSCNDDTQPRDFIKLFQELSYYAGMTKKCRSMTVLTEGEI